MGGPDPRRAGSGNIGAANLYRLLGRSAGAFTLAGDVLKGALPVFLARFALTGGDPGQEVVVAAVGLAAVLGHIFPLYLGFRGGKAVATSFGVVAVVNIAAAGALLLVYALVVSRFRILSLGSLAAAWLMPLTLGFFSDSKIYLLLSGILSLLILWRHLDNIVRLAQGEEPHLNFP
jgi:glycerol-3-phosphate acyltransferase PlsY